MLQLLRTAEHRTWRRSIRSSPMTPTNSSIRPKAAAEFLGISISTLWRWAKQRDDFPTARKLSPRCTVFNAEELVDWRNTAPPVHEISHLH